jgi:large subunit ribosomal protein L17
MRHRRAGRKLNRTGAHRRALFRNLVTAVLEHERVQTTDPKAKEVRRLTDRMITLGKRGSLHARRRALAFVRKESIVRKLFEDVAPRFASRPGGYTRVIKLGPRLGDAAPQSIVELTEREGEKERTQKARG